MMISGNKESVVNVHWTGGWDSTFRLIQLAREGAHIQPHYIIVPSRGSAMNELSAMQNIRKLLRHKYSECRINATRFVELDPDGTAPEIFTAYQRMLKAKHIGDQIMWFRQLADEIDNLELCVHRDDPAEYFVQQMLTARVR